jgi:hypothetical protein
VTPELKIIASVFERQKAHFKMSACSTAGRHHRAYLTAEGVGVRSHRSNRV